MQNPRQIKDAHEALREHFGFEAFREGQGDVVDKIISGTDGLVVMPTGGGKSLCYQLPALCLEGVCIVVSPLIALMKDQVDALLVRGVPATVINSTLTLAEQRERVSGMRSGKYKLVYVAPERFKVESFIQALLEVDISLFAIDEAHCLSQWGHDFRPDYMRLGAVLEKVGHPQCVALTATATADVRRDILSVLKLRNPFETVSGFARSNLSLNITTVSKHEQKYKRIREVIKQWKTGIVYCATRKRVDEIAEMLHDWGVSCIAYHGGMSDEQREKTQNTFIQREADVAVATNAFGMGIDRSDVRFVMHFEVPGSVEAYYQEAGRAGRDGKPSHCELLFNYADTRTQEFFIEGVNPTYKTICDLYQHLLNQVNTDFEVHETLDQMKIGADVKNGMSVGAALGVLMRQGMIERFKVNGSRVMGTRLLKPNVLTSKLEIDRHALEEKERRDKSKLAAMVELCYSHQCRQQWIMEYFGERDAGTCGSCDVCVGKLGEGASEGSPEQVMNLRKMLSGVARMSRKVNGQWEGRFGRGRVVQMLVGSKAKEILQNRLEELSTYGLLKDLGTAYLNDLMQSAHDAGLVQTQKGEYPLVSLSARGEEVMLDRAKPLVVWPGSAASLKTKEQRSDGLNLSTLGFDAELYERLRKLRAEIAHNEGVPAYQIFSNKTLEAMTRLRPNSVRSGRSVPGVGEKKADRYLARFVELIKTYS
ncbi:RecQ family ATP-dependent DNA helicase [Rubritalea marina]|uniref:RecQ family ATP-dependent DNA helicase n=1 Tax=Rubritalea marina TaxID=361055 RepID=UPI00037B3D5D|nr:ATP-dependent DNA helicase RecQ [Rubritalea marina]